MLARHKGKSYGQCLLFVCYKAEIIKHAFHVTLPFRKQVEWDLKSSSVCTFIMDRFQGPLGLFPSTVGPLWHVCILRSSISPNQSPYRISISCTFPAARPTWRSHVLSQYWRGTGPISSQQNDPARTRTWNLLIRSQTPSPLGHEADWIIVQSPLILTICTENTASQYVFRNSYALGKTTLQDLPMW